MEKELVRRKGTDGVGVIVISTLWMEGVFQVGVSTTGRDGKREIKDREG